MSNSEHGASLGLVMTRVGIVIDIILFVLAGLYWATGGHKGGGVFAVVLFGSLAIWFLWWVFQVFFR